MSPFRYPGGKTQLSNYIHHLLKQNNVSDMYIEPFAGGAGIPLKLLLENKIKRIWINDYDKSIYSVWYAILNKSEELKNKIYSVPFDYYTGHDISPEFSINFWKEQKKIYSGNKTHQNSVDLAFATLFLNRSNMSGIINGGPIGGYSQNGTSQIYSRFNKKTLINKITTISSRKKQIRLTRKNALDMIPMIKKEISPSSCFIFFDPPYFGQGQNLYYSSFNKKGHELLSKEILSLHEYRWITTYDKTKQITDMYQDNNKNFEYHLRYSANNKKRGSAPELLFASPTLKIDSYDKVNLLSI